MGRGGRRAPAVRAVVAVLLEVDDRGPADPVDANPAPVARAGALGLVVARLVVEVERADAHVAAAAARAADLAAEADAMLERSRQRSQEELDRAREFAERFVGQALGRAGILARDTEEVLRGIVVDAENHLADAQRQKRTLEEFVQRMRIVAAEAEGSVSQNYADAQRFRYAVPGRAELIA